MIFSDWHIHSEYSYDATNPLDTIAQAVKNQGLRFAGITDHANFNDEKFMGNLRSSVAAVKAAQQKYPFLILGVELTPIEKPEFDHIAKTGTREGYQPPVQKQPYEIELAATKMELAELGVRYAIGAPIDAWTNHGQSNCRWTWMPASGNGTVSSCGWPVMNGSRSWGILGITVSGSGIMILI